MKTVVMTLTDDQLDRIRSALEAEARELHKQANACAKAVGRWNDPAVKGLVDEAVSTEYLAAQFKTQRASVVRVKGG